jgi:phage shock protein PspC (stress-responsive transcriptional regulator)
MSKELVRRSDRAMVAGVCAGLADYLGWEVSHVRILYVVVSVFSAAFPGLLVYIILWFVMPKR